MTELDLPTPNLPLLRKVLDHVDAHPNEWDQTVWGTNHAIIDEYGKVAYDLQRDVTRCHTACCIAGWAVVIDGSHQVFFPAGGLMVEGYMTPGEAAQELLGLTSTEATLLFNGSNDRADVQRIARQIAERAGEVL